MEKFNYSDIEKNFCILASLERDGKRVLLCTNKETSNYSFFVDNITHYTFADEKLTNELLQVYKKQDPNRFDISMQMNCEFDSKEEQDCSEQDLKTMFEDCKQMILNHFCADNEENRIVIEKKLNSLKFVVNQKLKQRAYGFYKTVDHEIHVTKNVKKDIMLHEMIHAATAKEGIIIGYSTMYTIKYNPEEQKKSSYIISGSGITEAATQYHTEVAFGNTRAQFGCIYRQTMNIYHNLIKGIDPKLEKECFVLKNEQKFKELIVDYFHLENDELYKKLYFQLDSLLCVEKKSQPSLISDYVILTKQAYQTLIDMWQIKLSYENRYLEFDECITYDYLTDKILFLRTVDISIMEELHNYYDNNLAYDYKNEGNNTYDYEALYFADKCLNEGNCAIDDVPKYLRNTDFYAIVLNNTQAYNYNEKDELAKKVLKVILNPNNGFLPNDIEERQKFIKELIAKTDVEKFSIIKELPKNYIKLYLQTQDNDTYIARVIYLISKEPDYVLDNLTFLFNPKIINSSVFIYEFQDYLAHLENAEIILPIYNKFKTYMKERVGTSFDFDFMDKEVSFMKQDREELQK